MSLVCAAPYRAPVVKPPVEIEAVPRYGMGRFETYDETSPMFDIIMATQHNDFLEGRFVMPQAVEDDYYYYMSPVEFGKASFRFSGFTGGWDGASWPLDDMGEEYGPVVISYGGRDWNMYRTDWPGSMGGQFTVSFENV